MSTAEDRSSGASKRAVRQAPGLWRTDLQRQDLSVPGREMVQARVDIGPEAPLVRHTHPGEVIIYILEGSLEYQTEGQPPKTFHAGEALTVPAGVVHAVRNAGSGNAAELATYVVEKRKAAPHGGRVSASPAGTAIPDSPTRQQGKAARRRRTP
jgi:quercetin dioxygenase-like cupin family protein